MNLVAANLLITWIHKNPTNVVFQARDLWILYDNNTATAVIQLDICTEKNSC